MLLHLALLLVIGSFPVTIEANKDRALRFGQSTADYIEWSPNMAPFTRQFSVCTWLKKRHQSSNPMVVNYDPYIYGMILSDNGLYNLVVGSSLSLESEYNVPDGEWFHVCWLWSASSYTFTVYLNGEIIGSTATKERELRTGGTMCLGNYATSKHSNYIFGGDLFKLNIYSRVLTATEVRNMASDICSNEEESLNSIRSLRWESIILQRRSGSVTEITVCSPEEMEARRRAKMLRLIEERLEPFESRLQNTEQELARTKSNLIQSDKKLQNVTASLTAAQEKLKNSEQELADTKFALVQRLNQTEDKLENVTMSFNTTQVELNATRQELAGARNSLATLTASLTTAQEKIKNSEQELKETKSNLNQRLENVITSLTSTQNKLNDTEQELAEKQSTLNQRVSQTEKKLENVTTSLKTTQVELNNSEQELAKTKSTVKLFEEKLGSFNFSLTSTQNEVSNTQLELTSSKNHLTQQLESVTLSLNHTQDELEAATKNKVRSKWDVLFSDRFFNKQLTREMSQELKSAWDILGNFSLFKLFSDLMKYLVFEE